MMLLDDPTFIIVCYLAIIFAVLLIILVTLWTRKFFAISSDDIFADMIQKSRLEIFNSEPVRFANVDGLDFRYVYIHAANKILSPNKTIVLIHGVGASMYCWRHMVYELNRNFNVLAFDLPGFGFSGKPKDSDYGLDAQSKRVIDFINLMGLERFYLVGHSLGGVIAAWIAKNYPSRVEKLSLLAPGFSHKLKMIQPEHIMWFVGGVQKYLIRPEIVKYIYRRALTKGIPDADELPFNMGYIPFHNSPETAVAFVKSNKLLGDRRIKSELKNIDLPIQIIYGDKDKVILHRAVQYFCRMNPKAECHILKDTGHLLIEEDAKIVSEKIVSFFDAVNC